MWKTAFCLGMVLSLEAFGSSCNIFSVEGVLASFKENTRERELLVNASELRKAQSAREMRSPRPEVSLGFEKGDESFSQNEITAEILFNIDEYRKLGYVKKRAEKESELAKISAQGNFIERVLEGSTALFKSSQNAEFLKSIEAVERLIESSVRNYERRSLRSRDEEVALSSLLMMKKNIALKKALIEEEISSDKARLARWGKGNCELDLKEISLILKEIESYKTSNKEETLKLKELDLKKDLLSLNSDIDYKNSFSNFKIGPTFARDNLSGEKELRFGVALSFDFPSFDQKREVGFKEQTLKMAALERSYSKESYDIEKRILEQKIDKYQRMIKAFSGQNKAEDELLKLKRIFDQGVLSPIVYIDSYRSFLDSLESVMAAQNVVFESHLKLRGLYEENNIL